MSYQSQTKLSAAKFHVKVKFPNCVKVYIHKNIDAAIRQGKYWRDDRGFETKIVRA